MEERSFYQRHQEGLNFLFGTIATILGIVLIIAILVGLWVGFKSISRSQKRADASNQVTLNEIQIKQTEQLVQVAEQHAKIKIAEAHGIAESQHIINKTLTPQYLQHEAIQAQTSQSNKIIYVPSGNQGIPLVNTVNP